MILQKTIQPVFSMAKKVLNNRTLPRAAALALVILVAAGSMVTVVAAQRNVVIFRDDKQISATSTEKPCTNTAEATALLAEKKVVVGADERVSYSSENDVLKLTVHSVINMTVKVDGKTQIAKANHGDTVKSVLDKLNIAVDSADNIMPTPDSVIGKASLIEVQRGHNVYITADGQTGVFHLLEGTVQDALNHAGISISADDIVTPELKTKTADGLEIKVGRVTYNETTNVEVAPFKDVQEEDATLAKGITQVKNEGVDGWQTVVSREKLVDGVVVSTEVVSTAVTQAPVDKVTIVGAKAGNGAATLLEDGTVIDPEGKTVSYSKMWTEKCSAYTGGGTTSTGAPAAMGRVAVNPNLIPYGTKMFVCSPDGKTVYGYAVAADTGGACMKNIIALDLYYDTYEGCKNIGVRNMNIYFLND